MSLREIVKEASVEAMEKDVYPIPLMVFMFALMVRGMCAVGVDLYRLVERLW